jgi:hypothetical protein
MLAEELYERLETSKTSMEKQEEVLHARGTPLGVLDNGNPWWDIFSVRLGLKPAEINRELNQIRDHLRSLIVFSDQLEVRAAIVQAYHALHSITSSASALQSQANTL